MSSTPTSADIAAIQDLIERSELASVECHELSARWTGNRGERDHEQSIEMELQLQHRIGDGEFGYRMVGNIETGIGDVTAAVAVTYNLEGDIPDLRTIFGFGNEVAVMVLFPYYREAVSSITAKVFGQPILLPVATRGTIAFELDDAPEPSRT